MGSNKENAQHFTPPTSRPQLPPSSLVFPPLPPLSPSDEENSWPGKTPPLPPLEPTATCSEAPSRRFGVEITNVLSTDAGASTRDNMVIKPPSPRAAEASKRYYQQLPQHSSLKTSHIVKKGKPALTFSADRGLKTPSMKWSATVEEDMRELTQPFSVLSLKSPLAPEVKELDKDALQSGNTIWSITPVELSALEDEMIAVNAQSIERFGKLSYAEASKRNLPGLTENHGEHKKTEEGVDQPRRVFKKYYALPVFTPSGLHQYEPEAFEEKEAPPVAGFRLSSGNKDPLDGLCYTQSVGLSANTPTFYPRQATDTSELIQMLKVSLSSKKVAPHMDWWPGDWKCTNCGNHNFSYRDACKRCRVGRQEDAGFVFSSSSSSDPST